MLNGKIVLVANGANLAAAVAAINGAVDGVTASSSAGTIRLTADDSATSIALTDGDLADLGLAPGVTPPTAALPAGYALYADVLTDDEKKTTGVVFATVAAGEGVSVLTRSGEYSAARVTFSEDGDLGVLRHGAGVRTADCASGRQCPCHADLERQQLHRRPDPGHPAGQHDDVGDAHVRLRRARRYRAISGSFDHHDALLVVQVGGSSAGGGDLSMTVPPVPAA